MICDDIELNWFIHELNWWYWCVWCVCVILLIWYVLDYIHIYIHISIHIWLYCICLFGVDLSSGLQAPPMRTSFGPWRNEDCNPKRWCPPMARSLELNSLISRIRSGWNWSQMAKLPITNTKVLERLERKTNTYISRYLKKSLNMCSIETGRTRQPPFPAPVPSSRCCPPLPARLLRRAPG